MNRPLADPARRPAPEPRRPAARIAGRSLAAVRRRGPLDEIADELYSCPPAEFTVARNTAAREARKGGDTELADSLQRMHKPTVAAWLANLLVRERSREVAHLVELGTALRKAQAAFDGEALRRLSEQRHGVVRSLSQDARRLADERDQKLSDAVLRELEGTLEAAVFDPDAAVQLQRGRLTGALAYSGIGFPSLVEASPSSSSTGALTESRGKSPTRAGRTPGRKPAEGHLRDASSKGAPHASALRLADREAQGARRAAQRATTALRDAERACEREKAALSAAEEELARRREVARAARRALARARADQEAAQRRARRAEQRAETVRRKGS